jgi:hypothetical protein
MSPGSVPRISIGKRANGLGQTGCKGRVLVPWESTYVANRCPDVSLGEGRSLTVYSNFLVRPGREIWSRKVRCE